MKTLHNLIDSFQENDSTAIIEHTEYRTFSYTYAELHSLACRFAALMQSENIARGDKILLWSTNSAAYAVTLLGAALAGVIVVPIDVHSSIEMVKRVHAQVKAKCIIQSRFKSRLSIPTYFADDLLAQLPDAKQTKITPARAQDIVQIIYTSGTTGDPKGVVLTHDNYISNVHAAKVLEDIRPSHRFLSLLPLSHIFEQTVGFYIPLSNGATIVYPASLKPSSFMPLFASERITHVAVVPRLLDLFASSLRQRIPDVIKRVTHPVTGWFVKRAIHKRFGKIKYFFCGGAPLSEEIEQFYESLGLPIVQGYGLTETTGILTANTFAERRIGSVGKVLPGMEIRIGKNGEILAKGRICTSGYYKRKDVRLYTRGGWLQTGDVGRIDEDGYLFLKGRKKDLIVTPAGINVYPEDIEQKLRAVPAVKDACVIGKNTPKGETVHAVLLLKKRASPDTIVQQVNATLNPSQQITSHSTWPLDDFPRTPTLKIKKFEVKKMLAKKATEKPSPERKGLKGFLMRYTDKRITPSSTLQSLGLSSIDLIELATLIENEYVVDLSDADISPQTTVKTLEKRILERRRITRAVIEKAWESFPTSLFARAILDLLLLPVVRVFAWCSVTGIENVSPTSQPVIYASNHQSHFDAPLILGTLDHRARHSTFVAAWQEYFFNKDLTYRSFRKKIAYYLLTLFLSIYPFSQEAWFRKSARHTGSLIDRGNSILIFPEGKRSPAITSFENGIGFLAKEMHVPIIPVRIRHVDDVLPIGAILPRFARVHVTFGAPIIITDESAIEATQRIEAAVRNL